MTYIDFIETLRRNSDETARNYGTTIRTVASAFGKAPDEILTDIKTGKLDLIQFFRQMMTWSSQQNHRTNTTRYHLSVWIQFLRYEGVKVDRDDVKTQVRPPKTIRTFGGRPFTREELTKILDIVNLKYRTMILLGATSGMRAGEIGALRVGDIDFSKSPVEILVHGETSKSGRDRDTFCSDEAATHLKSFIGEGKTKNDFIFTMEEGKRFTSNAVSVATARILARAKIREKNGNAPRHTLSFHSLRKYFTTHMVQEGVPLPIVELLCGREIGVTQSYLMPSSDQMRKYYADHMQKVILTQVEADVGTLRQTVDEDKRKIAELEGRLTDMRSHIAVEVARAFQAVKSVEDQINAQQNKIKEIGQQIFDEIFEEEQKDVSPEFRDNPPSFVSPSKVPTTWEDFNFSYYNSDEGKDETGYIISESMWEKVRKHANWRRVVEEYARLSELQEKAEKLRTGSTET